MTNSQQDQSIATWFKSSYSEGSGNACVEVADMHGLIAVRDSKDTSIPGLRVSGSAWAAFTADISS
ncbi:DUF397 domain-containing protein [Streptomyces sp. NPDC048430]|uniref:DUF397 domain-containing protein n=1 Tax=Streptomyces sp. NPDC048430 TaxID=3155388 RepID=UPI00341C3D68